MSKRAGTTVHIDGVMRQTKVPHRSHWHDRESFVDLKKPHVLQVPTGFYGQLLYRSNRRGRKKTGFVRVPCMSDHPGQRRQPALFSFRGAHHDKCGGPVGNRRGIGSRDRALAAERGAQVADLVALGFAGLLVDLHHRLAAARCDRNGRDFIRERTAVNRSAGAVKRCDSIIVLRLSGELIAFCAILGKCAHETALVVGVLQTIEEHVVLQFCMAHPKPRAGFLDQIGRVGHALHPASDNDARRACDQHIMGIHRSFHTRAAHLVQRGADCAERKPSAKGRLPRGRLTLTCAQHIAECHLIHVLGCNARACHSSPDRSAAQLVRGDRGEITFKAAHRCACSGDDNNRIGLGHDSPPFDAVAYHSGIWQTMT